ncbi:MAG: DUF2070 family protein [Candidatus Methanomethylicia archaeon]|nr:DUF2070 family protein [Candidatus Methanomethylicia archaeon]MCX8169188.1 DUF2070 family protein [Candidatus Methanomethylicia archaeon]MDW7989030.1 DUF2070 family protein [Nitrososphaerota archaeon]
MDTLIEKERFNKYLDRAVEHYSSLFTLPSYKRILTFLFIICIFEGFIITPYHILKPLSFIYGLCFGIIFFILTLLLNYFSVFYIFKEDKIYNVRRLSGLSLFSWIFWTILSTLGLFTTIITANYIWVVKFSLLGFSITLILRFVVLYATSSSSYKRIFIVAILQPFLSLIFLIFIWKLFNVYDFILALSFSIFSIIIALTSSYCFLHVIDSTGKKYFEESFLPIFKAFLLNWIADLNEPLEYFFEKFGEERDVEVSLIRFHGSNKAFIVVPSVHPGPFKNIGGSALPSKLKYALEKKFDCITCVLLGLVEHHLDLTSQYQLEKLIHEVIENADISVEENEASPFIKVSNGLATVCCHVFGETALLSLSLAPNTTEDLPIELNMDIRKEAERLGFKNCVIVNAHNSINGDVEIGIAYKTLKEKAIECLEKAISSKKSTFKMGVSHIIPSEFTLKDGMGPGGITAIVFEIDGKRSTYIVIDGNNMVSGLRERIINEIKYLGIDDCEVFTTDTHLVTALTLRSRRGYHPIGEAINQSKIIKYIVEVVQRALGNICEVNVGFKNIIIPRIKVIGRENMEKLCVLIDHAIKKAKKIAYPIFGISFLILTTVIVFI